MVPLHVLEALGYAPGQARKRLSITTASGSQIAPLLTLGKVKVLGKAMAKVPAIFPGCWVIGKCLPRCTYGVICFINDDYALRERPDQPACARA